MGSKGDREGSCCWQDTGQDHRHSEMQPSEAREGQDVDPAFIPIRITGLLACLHFSPVKMYPTLWIPELYSDQLVLSEAMDGLIHLLQQQNEVAVSEG